MAIRKPPRLRPGDTVGVFAPAAPWENRSELLRAVAALEGWGLEVLLGSHIDDRHGYFAGADRDRTDDFHALLTHPEVKAVFGLQGGYGSPRLIPLLDPDILGGPPKALCGFSDITILHLALARWSDTISFYSNGASGVGSPKVTEWSKETLRRALFSDEPYGEIAPSPDDPYVRTIIGGEAQGRLTGGCTGLIVQTIGTPIEIDARDRILVLEEIELGTEDFDAMLTHLRNAGILEQAAGIVVGDVTTKQTGYVTELSTEDVLEELLAPLGVPVIYGLPVGHGKHHHTVPMGAMATLDADAGRLVIDEVVTAEP
jgi:muramoyltetrapeptide carboxypeptidase